MDSYGREGCNGIGGMMVGISQLENGREVVSISGKEGELRTRFNKAKERSRQRQDSNELTSQEVLHQLIDVWELHESNDH